MKDKDRALELLKEAGAVPEREARHGTLYRFPSGRTLLVHRDGQATDPYAWTNVCRDVKRIVAQDAELKERLDVEQPSNGAAIRVPEIPGLKVASKTSRVVIEETTNTLELAPHQVHGLLRLGGVPVPDDAKVTFTNQGYVRIAWTQTRESTEA